MKVSIIIPAYNEESRIGNTLQTYCSYFKNLEDSNGIKTTFLVVLNGCKDRTLEVVTKLQKQYSSIKIMNLTEAGKGLAVTEGFKDALQNGNDFIGFVDADMATRPKYFYELIEKIGDTDVIFCSRYMTGSTLLPQRPWIKKWGRELIYNPLVRILMGINFRDFQCGAKLFKAHVVKTILPKMTMKDWAFDIELIYLSKKSGFKLKEIPTTWFDDQAGSKFKMITDGSKMLSSIVKLRIKHSRLRNKYNTENNKNK